VHLGIEYLFWVRFKVKNAKAPPPSMVEEIPSAVQERTKITEKNPSD